MSQKLTATLRLQLINGVSGEAKEIEDSLKRVDKSLKGFGKGGTPAVDLLTRKLAALKKQTEAYDNYRKAQSRQFAAGAEFNKARMAVESYAKEMAKAGAPSQAMRRNMFFARNEVKLAAAAFREETNAANAAKKALESLAGVGAGKLVKSQRQIREEIKRTADELRKANQEAKKASNPPSSGGRRGGGSAAGIIGGAGAVYYGKTGSQQAFFNAVNMDEATRFQRAVGGISEEKQKPLTQQAFKIGQETRYTNQDVVEAQTQLIQAGVRDIDTILNLTESVKNYSLAMRVTMDEGADTVRSVLQSTNKDISDPKKAKKVADEMVNFMVDMAKRGGMSDSDIQMFFKYGGASGKASGFSDSTLGSVGVQLRRGGLHGEEAGVFMRAAAAKMVSPTNKGQAALNTMGIEYSDYASMPDVLSADNIEKKFKRDFGKKLTKSQKSDLEELLQNGSYIDEKTGEEMPIGADQSVFTEKVSEILSGSFQKDKKGKMAAADSNKLAAKLGEFYKLSVESVDVEGLFAAIMESNPTLAQLNAMFTERQGGRAAIVRDRYASFKADKYGLEHVPGDRAKQIGDEVHGGMYGDWMQLTGAVETLFTKIGQDWESTISPLMKGLSATIDAMANAPQSIRMLATAATGAAVALGGITAVRGISGILSSLLGGTAGAAATGGGGFLAGLLGGAGRGALGILGSGPAMAAGGYGGAMYLLNQLFPGDAVKGRPGQYGQAAYPKRTYSDGSSDVRPMPGIQGETNSLDAFEMRAKDVGRTSKEALSFTATPGVNLSALDALIAHAKAGSAALQAIGGGIPTRVQGGHSDARPMPSSPSGSGVMGRRALGGSVAAGREYIVGERGEERVSFASNGYVTPNSKISGSRIGRVNFNINSTDPMGAAREIERVLSQLLGRSHDLAIDGR